MFACLAAPWESAHPLPPTPTAARLGISLGDFRASAEPVASEAADAELRPPRNVRRTILLMGGVVSRPSFLTSSGIWTAFCSGDFRRIRNAPSRICSRNVKGREIRGRLTHFSVIRSRNCLMQRELRPHGGGPSLQWAILTPGQFARLEWCQPAHIPEPTSPDTAVTGFL